MKITEDQATAGALEDLGFQAARLLCSGDFTTLAKNFGYALAYYRDPAAAIREDLMSTLAELGACRLAHPPSTPPSVSFFSPNDTGLLALVEQRIATDIDRHILLELVLSTDGPDKYVYLEQVSAAV
jgi:hypothetical protein